MPACRSALTGSQAKPAPPSPAFSANPARLVVYALMSGEPVTIAPLDLMRKVVVVKGFFLNHPDVELKIPSALRETAPLVASGMIRVPIAATYPLTAFREAVAHVQRGGKVMFDVDGASSRGIPGQTKGVSGISIR